MTVDEVELTEVAEVEIESGGVVRGGVNIEVEFFLMRWG